MFGSCYCRAGSWAMTLTKRRGSHLPDSCVGCSLTVRRRCRDRVRLEASVGVSTTTDNHEETEIEDRTCLNARSARVLIDDDLGIAVVAYMDWFNHRRLHGEIGTIPPTEYENLHHATRPATRRPGLHTLYRTRCFTPAGAATVPVVTVARTEVRRGRWITESQALSSIARG